MLILNGARRKAQGAGRRARGAGRGARGAGRGAFIFHFPLTREAYFLPDKSSGKMSACRAIALATAGVGRQILSLSKGRETLSGRL